MPTTRALVIAVAAVAASFAAPARAAAPAARPLEAPHESVVRAVAVYSSLEKAEVEKLSRLLDGLIADADVVATFQARDREKLLSRTKQRFETLRSTEGVTHWYFLDPAPARTCFLRVHSPTLFGDVVERPTFTQAIASGKIGFGKELGKTAFALRVVKPILTAGAIVGYMELGEEIGDFLEKMKKQTGDDYGILVDKARIDRKLLAKVRGEDRWDERPDVVLVDSTIWNERLLDLPVRFDQIPDQGIRTGEWSEGRRKFLGGAFPLRDAASQVVGVLYVRHSLGT
jgi:hypothetical protein